MNPEAGEAGRKSSSSQIRLIVCDMDGTLLDSEKRISGRTLETIREARRKGVVTTICSGRLYLMLGVYVRRLALDVPFIASNGGVIFDPLERKILYQELLPSKDAGELFDFCKQNGLDYCALGPTGGFFLPGSRCARRFENYNKLAEETGVEAIPLHLFDSRHENALRVPLHKALVYRDGGKADVLIDDFFTTRSILRYTFSDPFVADVAPPEVDKGRGVARLAQIMGIGKEEICVFGDYNNDLPMFREAGLSVAMGNACQEAKDLADVVTSSNDDDGVAEAIRKYIL
jgi:Cof subfamily protein (haloacid dehalogenase superfamily)